MGMGAIGRALAAGVGGAANMAAGSLQKDYERNQELGAKMSLEDYAHKMRMELETRRQEFEGGQQNARIASAEKVAKERVRVDEAGQEIQRGQLQETTRGAKERERLEGLRIQQGAAANALAQKRMELEQAKFQFEKDGKLDVDTKAALDQITARLKGTDDRLEKLNDDNDPTGKQREAVIQQQAALTKQYYATLSQRFGPTPGGGRGVNPDAEPPPAGKPEPKKPGAVASAMSNTSREGQTIGPATPWSTVEDLVDKGDPAAIRYAREWLAKDQGSGHSMKIEMPASLRQKLQSLSGPQ